MSDVDVKFSADMEDIKQRLDEIERNTSSWTEKLKQGFANAFTIDVLHGFEEAVRGVFEGIYGIFEKSIEEAEEHELVMTRLELSLDHVRGGFAYTSESIKQWADSLEYSTGVTEESIERMAASLARFHVSGETFRDAVKVSLDIAAEQGGSAEGVASKVGRALAGLEQGQGGAVRRLREELADLTEEEKNHITELAKVGKGHEAVGLVMDELNRKYKDAAEIVGQTLHGQMERLRSVFSNVYEEIGNGLLPYIKELLPTFIELSAYAVELAASIGHLAKAFAESSTGKTGFDAIKDALMNISATVVVIFERIPLYFEKIKAEFDAFIAHVRASINALMADLPKATAAFLGIDQEAARNAASGKDDLQKYNEERAKLVAESNSAFRASGNDTNAPSVIAAQKAISDLDEKQKDPFGLLVINQALRDNPFDEAIKTQLEHIHDAAKKLSQESAEGALNLDAMIHSVVSFPEHMANEAKSMWNRMGATYTQAAKESLEKTDKQIDELKEKRVNQLREGDFLGAAQTQLGLEETQNGQRTNIQELQRRRSALEETMRNEWKSDEITTKPFKSAIEDASAVFKRIQVSAASDPDKDDIPKKQLTELGKLAEGQITQINNQLKEHDLRVKLGDTLDKLHSFIKTGPKAA